MSSLVVSRDAIMHIEDKKSLYKNFYKTLKPGGQLLVTDYCWGNTVSRVMDNTYFYFQLLFNWIPYSTFLRTTVGAI